jgi:hypothetical protein
MSVSSDFQLTVLSIVISALVSGLLGVIISNWYHGNSETRRLKIQILQQIMAYRFSLQNIKFVEAMNQLPVVYHESKEVLTAYKEYREHIMNHGDPLVGHQKLVELLKAMYKNLRINIEPLNDDMFSYPFIPDTGKNPAQKNQIP